MASTQVVLYFGPLQMERLYEWKAKFHPQAKNIEQALKSELTQHIPGLEAEKDA